MIGKKTQVVWGKITLCLEKGIHLRTEATPKASELVYEGHITFNIRSSETFC